MNAPTYLDSRGVLSDLSVPLRALRLVCADFPELPAPTVGMTPIHPDRLALSFHHTFFTDSPLRAFEAWRAALGVPDTAVDGRFQSGGETWVLRAETEYAGARVELTAYAQAPATPPANSAGAW
ncbi:hypothetical protein ACIQNU_04810 [Streptomyces sp. NPDC091292]|uniref:hypothetical protein n=1 Tax=Streptomyces sp. NPDC091292 TaxID=3365991 RepID=UPI0038112DD0